MIANK
jgi:Ran GTPase-activating protein (RanGAP) involved in mRNA processing and transport